MLEAEWGSSHPVALAKSTFLDGEPYPLCDICGEAKTMLIGRGAYQLICTLCDNKMSEKDLLVAAFLKNLAS
jgi:hypothetical protein